MKVKTKNLGILAAVAAIAAGGWYFMKNGNIDKLNLSGNGTETSVSDESLAKSASHKTITIAGNTYVGFKPVVLLTEKYAKDKFGLNLKFVKMDDINACRSAFMNNDIDIVYCTLDALPVEMGKKGSMAKAKVKYFMPLNFSVGADILIADKTIKTINDLKGKRVAYAEGTASHTLLMNVLETNGMTMNDIIPVKVTDGIEAKTFFLQNNPLNGVNAACIWAPDDEECLKSIPGSHVLIDTKSASRMISDGLLAKESWLTKNKDVAKKIAEAIYWANSEMYNASMSAEGDKVFAKVFEMDEEFSRLSGTKVNYMTITDAYNWMGLNTTTYKGATGADIYAKMSMKYYDAGLVTAALPWNEVVYTDIVRSLYEDGHSLTNNQAALSTADITYNTNNVDITKADAISQKKVTIPFNTGSYTLDENSKFVIDSEFLGIAKQFYNTFIRIEGNTDQPGNYNSNVELSKRRAEAVKNYLISQGIDSKRIVTVGNGPKHAIEDKVTGPNQNYRTTDFRLVVVPDAE